MKKPSRRVSRAKVPLRDLSRKRALRLDLLGAEQLAPVAGGQNRAAEDGDAEKSEDFWEKDESQLKLDPPPADAAPTAPDYAAFQGVKFSE